MKSSNRGLVCLLPPPSTIDWILFIELMGEKDDQSWNTFVRIGGRAGNRFVGPGFGRARGSEGTRGYSRLNRTTPSSSSSSKAFRKPIQASAKCRVTQERELLSRVFCKCLRTSLLIAPVAASFLITGSVYGQRLNTSSRIAALDWPISVR